ncbi:hypothetical protein CHUAL_000606 [Chamberlinius hualienensis]
MADRSCWKCGVTIDVASLSCSHCNTIQAVNRDFNYYKLFGVSQRFSLDVTQLTERFRQLQSAVHPDKFSGKSQIEQDYSNACSSLLNSAYKTLINPIDRGNYLLKLEQQATVNETDVSVNTEFLVDIMELNETLADNPTVEELEIIHCDNKQMIATLTGQLTESFNGKDWSAVKELLIKLKYYNNIEEKIKELQLKSHDSQ